MITVLRLGHRPERDARITTHVGLVARALGAGRIILSGEQDARVAESWKRVPQNWGGRFAGEYRADWRRVMRNFRGAKVHLTMYGEPVQRKIGAIRSHRNVLVVVGAEKVPPDAYNLADYNVAVTNQPHSEVAALAIFLHMYFRGRELDKKFPNARLRIVPVARGKKIIAGKK
jgi:tRNA (cytidine56-2'-O)-methyltransferase